MYTIYIYIIYISIKKQGKPDKKPGSNKAKKKCFIEGSRIIWLINLKDLAISPVYNYDKMLGAVYIHTHTYIHQATTVDPMMTLSACPLDETEWVRWQEPMSPKVSWLVSADLACLKVTPAMWLI